MSDYPFLTSCSKRGWIKKKQKLPEQQDTLLDPTPSSMLAGPVHNADPSLQLS
jgi:hypothetical protein